jgi:transposase
MTQQKQKLFKTIWRIPDELWNQVKQILDDYDPPKLIGRKRIDARAALDAMIFRLRSRCHWLSKCRAILVRYDKKACNYLGMLKLACALLWYRRCWRLSKGN